MRSPLPNRTPQTAGPSHYALLTRRTPYGLSDGRGWDRTSDLPRVKGGRAIGPAPPYTRMVESRFVASQLAGSQPETRRYASIPADLGTEDEPVPNDREAVDPALAVAAD
jgi:hypothetical protein